MGATLIDGAVCQRHTFSADRNGVQTNDADGKSGKLYGWLLIIRCTRCSKAGQYLKPLLIQCALAAVKSKKEPYFAIKYQRLSKRRGKKKAIIAIARMMLTSIYHMLSDNEDFHPDDYEATIHPPKQKPVVLTLDNTLQFLREQGADPETLKLIRQQCVAQAG